MHNVDLLSFFLFSYLTFRLVRLIARLKAAVEDQLLPVCLLCIGGVSLDPGPAPSGLVYYVQEAGVAVTPEPEVSPLPRWRRAVIVRRGLPEVAVTSWHLGQPPPAASLDIVPMTL